MALPDPLDIKQLDQQLAPQRILTDRGIRKAFELKLIETVPIFDEKDTTRIQPATLDVKLQNVDGCEPIEYIQGLNYNFRSAYDLPHTLQSKQSSVVNLTEFINFGQLDFFFHAEEILKDCKTEQDIRDAYLLHNDTRFFGVSSEARSSLRRLGIYMENHGGYFFSDRHSTKVELGNFGPNDIHFKQGDRIAQLFFNVDPYLDVRYARLNGANKKLDEKGQLVRTLEMGVEAKGRQQIIELQKEGYIEITPHIKTYRGLFGVHASKTAYKMKQIEGGIEFSKRDSCPREQLLEPIDITKGYTVQPFEHIIIETIEQFKLSPHVGIRFWDNLVIGGRYQNIRKRDPFTNMKLCDLTDGWVDPGYSGGFSRQPKWLTGRRIKPGDLIGFGQFFYFPNGVATSYGSTKLGSQYQNKEKTEFSSR